MHRRRGRTAAAVPVAGAGRASALKTEVLDLWVPPSSSPASAVAPSVSLLPLACWAIRSPVAPDC
eukprot:7372076-Pyramimonas_sp.AAC.1